MWKLQNFPVTQILREIKIGKSKVSKSAILTNWEALKSEFWFFMNTVKSPLEAAASNIFGGVFAAALIQVRLEFGGGQ